MRDARKNAPAIFEMNVNRFRLILFSPKAGYLNAPPRQVSIFALNWFIHCERAVFIKFFLKSYFGWITKFIFSDTLNLKIKYNTELKCQQVFEK